MKNIVALLIAIVTMTIACSEKQPPKAETLPESKAPEAAVPEVKKYDPIKAIDIKNVLNETTFEGNFSGIEEGDYYHVAFENNEGTTISFWLSPSIEYSQLVEFMENDELIGSPMKVKVKEVESYIPEAEATLTVLLADEIIY